MIAIGNGETCPFCKGEDKFISQPDNDFLTHLLETHSDKVEDYIFGDYNIGV